MKLEIKRITESDYPSTHRILSNSYPDFTMPKKSAYEWFDKIINPDKTRDFWGAFIDSQQVGVFVTNDFTLNFRNQLISAGGIGMVAVDLLHKKEKICKQMIEFYENYYREKETNLLVLYPFRPDFYHKMGFGFGSTLHAYSIEPNQFPKYPKTNKLDYASLDDLAEITDFYNQQVKSLHGAMLRQERELEGWLKSNKMRCLLYRENKQLQGYLFFYFDERLPENKGSFDIKVKEMQFKSVDVWRQFSTFLNSQADQVKRIQYTTFDPDFYHYFGTPNNETNLYYHPIQQNISLEKTGLMYKIIDPLKFFETLQDNTYDTMDLTIRFELENELFPKNRKIILTYNFANKKIVQNEVTSDLTIKLNLARFSSLVIGALSFSSAVKHGLVEVNNKNHIDCVDKLLRTKNMPVGYNEF